jgi:hypothetical protein
MSLAGLQRNRYGGTASRLNPNMLARTMLDGALSAPVTAWATKVRLAACVFLARSVGAGRCRRCMSAMPERSGASPKPACASSPVSAPPSRRTRCGTNAPANACSSPRGPAWTYCVPTPTPLRLACGSWSSAGLRLRRSSDDSPLHDLYAVLRWSWAETVGPFSACRPPLDAAPAWEKRMPYADDEVAALL